MARDRSALGLRDGATCRPWTSALRRLAASACVCGVIVASFPARATPAAEQHIVAGEEALAAEDWEDAGESFERAYAALDGTGQSGRLGEHVVFEAVSALERAYAASRDLALLRRAEVLLLDLQSVRGGTLPNPDLEAALERVQAAVEDAEPEPEPGERPPPPAVLPINDAAEPDVTGPSPAGPDKAGVALVVSGSLAALGGAALLVWGSQIPRLSRAALADRGGTSTQDASFLAEADRSRNTALIPGALLLSLGIGLIVWGAVRLHRSGRRR